MISRTGFAALLLALALVPDDARAQPPSQSFELRQTVSPGDIVWVTDDTGKRTKGRVAAISDASLTIITGSRSQEVVFAPDRTARIERPDSVSNGILIGLAGGAAVGYGWVQSNCGPPGFDVECSANAGIILFPISLGIGAGVGALVDGAIHKTLYRSSQRSRVSVVPVVGKDRRGVHLSLSF